LHELEALNSLITGVNRNKEKNAPFPKSAQRAIKDTTISFNNVKEYMILASETYFESGKTEKETDLYEKSRKAAIECRPKIKYLADLLIEHKKLFGDETDVSELYVVYKDWKV
jgi:hypothetical protein